MRLWSAYYQTTYHGICYCIYILILFYSLFDVLFYRPLYLLRSIICLYCQPKATPEVRFVLYPELWKMCSIETRSPLASPRHNARLPNCIVIRETGPRTTLLEYMFNRPVTIPTRDLHDLADALGLTGFTNSRKSVMTALIRHVLPGLTPEELQAIRRI